MHFYYFKLVLRHPVTLEDKMTMRIPRKEPTISAMNAQALQYVE